VHAFGLNRMDLLQREGRYPAPPHAPSTLGVEFSGIIESLGPDTDSERFKPGDAVFGLTYGGAYAEYVVCSLRTLLRKPEGLSHVQAAALPEVWMTATCALEFVLLAPPRAGHALGSTWDGDRPLKGKTILWHAGASAVSIAGAQLAKLAGAEKVFATAGTDEKCRFVEEEVGVARAFNYRAEDWVAGLLEATGGKGVDMIVDFVGGSYFQKNVDVVARDGRICLLGLLGGAVTPAPVDIGKLLYKRVRIEGSTLRSRDEEYQGKLRDRLEEYLPRFQSGELKIIIDTVLPWEDIVKAHQRLESNATKGKIICTIGE